MTHEFIEVDADHWADFTSNFRCYQTEIINSNYTDMQSKLTFQENPRNNGVIVAYVRYYKNDTKAYFITTAYSI